VRRYPGSGTLAALVAIFSLPVSADVSRAATPTVQHAQTGPSASIGDLRFHAGAVAYRHSPKEGRVEFSIRVPYRQIHFVPITDRYEARLRISVEMKGGSGGNVPPIQKEASVQSLDLAATTDSLLGEIYTAGMMVGPGKYTYKVTVEDLNAFRTSLVSKVKKQHRAGTVSGSVDVGPWLFRDPALSGVLFAWDIGEGTGETDFTKGPYEVMPQPSAYYGRYQQSMFAYYEIYDTPPPPDGRTYHLSETVTALAGDTLFARTDTLMVTEGAAWPHALEIDVSTFPAGHYSLRLALSTDQGPGRATSQGDFDVIWDPESWSDDAADLYDVTAETLLSSDSAEVFRGLPMGEQERWVERMWNSADPTPDTAENERRTEFYRRVAYAQRNFSVIGLGMYSDRGRVYIRYGEPDEIKIDRVPTGTNTLGYSLGNEIPPSSKSRITDNSAGTTDMRAYEIWTYDHRGQELVPRYGVSEIASGLKFVFVDDQGYGDYRLSYSSTSGLH
jgi:GWxTD domain-containing protein